MQILLDMLGETDVLPEQQIGFVQTQALKLYAFPPDPNRIPKWTWQGEEHFPHSCLLPHKKRKYGHFSQPRFCRPSFRGCDRNWFANPTYTCKYSMKSPCGMRGFRKPGSRLLPRKFANPTSLVWFAGTTSE